MYCLVVQPGTRVCNRDGGSCCEIADAPAKYKTLAHMRPSTKLTCRALHCRHAKENPEIDIAQVLIDSGPPRWYGVPLCPSHTKETHSKQVQIYAGTVLVPIRALWELA